MKLLPGVLALLLLLAGDARAQRFEMPDAPPPVPKSIPLDGPLQHAWLLRDASLAELRARVGPVPVNDARELHVRIVAPRGEAIAVDELVRLLGGRIDARVRDAVDLWLPPEALLPLALALPPGHALRHVQRPKQLAIHAPPVIGEGPLVMGSASYISQGANGIGETVAIVDASFGGISASLAAGEAPVFTAIDYAAGNFEEGGNHGTLCTEVVFDHAPGATYRLYRVDSSLDLSAVVDDCKNNGVDVISMSLGFLNEGWADDSGYACDAVREAGQGGILVFVSAGNEALKHHQANFRPSSSAAIIHDWIPGDPLLAMTVPPLGKVKLSLQWDEVRPSDVYDLFLFDALGRRVLASSGSGQDFEVIEWSNPNLVETVVNAAVQLNESTGVQFELFVEATKVDGTKVTGGELALEYPVTFSSILSPSNASHAFVYSIGAVHWSDYASPPRTGGIVTSYSSRGPTNSGRQAPDLMAPSGIATFSIAEFHGTSASAPNAAGAALCFLSSLPTYWADAQGWLIERMAGHFKDWGLAGPDSSYGIGGVSLIPYEPGTIYLARDYGNTGEQSAGPNFRLAAAVSQIASTGGRVLAFPPDAYPERPVVLDAQGVRIDAAGGPSIFGE